MEYLGRYMRFALVGIISSSSVFASISSNPRNSQNLANKSTDPSASFSEDIDTNACMPGCEHHKSNT